MPCINDCRALLILCFISLSGCVQGERSECIAPANPGGGWDLTCRSLQGVLQDLDLVEGRFSVSNMPGAGGGVAFAHVVTERSNEDHLLVAASTGTTLRIAHGFHTPLVSQLFKCYTIESLLL